MGFQVMNIKKTFYKSVHGPKHHWWALSVTSLGAIITTYDTGAVNISLPQVMTSYQTNISTVSWVLLSYLLTTTSLLLPAGRLGDFIGRKKIYILGFIIFIAGSALCGISQSPWQLILFRILQGVGASMLQTNSFAIVAAVFPVRQRGKGLGFNSTLAAIGITSGPAIGGLIVHIVGWRGIFFLNIPVGLVGTVLAHLVLKEELVSPPPTEKHQRHFDLAGAGLASVGIVSLMIGLSLGQKGNWHSTNTLLFLGCAAFALAAFPWFESRRKHPLVDIKLFKNRTFVFNNVARLICFLATSSNSLLMPFFLQVISGYSPFKAGLFIAPLSVVFALISPISGWLTNYITTRILTSIGMAIMGLSLYSFSQLNPSSGYSDILGGLLLLGLGVGLFQTPNNTSVMDSVPKESFGIASGILALVRQTGHALGIAIASTIVVTSMYSTVGKISLYSIKRGARVLEQGDALAAFSDGIGKAFFFASLLCILGVIFSLIRGKTERDTGEHTR